MVFKQTVIFLLVASLALASSDSEEIAEEQIIAGSSLAEPHEFPYHISLQWNFNDDSGRIPIPLCGGSLLDEYHILTAAYCKFEESSEGYLEAVAAEHSILRPEISEQRREIVSFILHDDYIGRGGNDPNNIAVFRVGEPFQLNDMVKTVRLPEQSGQFNGNVTMTGWGTMSSRYSPVFTDKLRKVILPLVDYDTCLELWDHNRDLKETNICAGPIDETMSACSGDAGGPLVKLVDEDVVQVGVVSWGTNPCGTSAHPTVFMAVAKYADWIKDQLRQ